LKNIGEASSVLKETNSRIFESSAIVKRH